MLFKSVYSNNSINFINSINKTRFNKYLFHPRIFCLLTYLENGTCYTEISMSVSYQVDPTYRVIKITIF